MTVTRIYTFKEPKKHSNVYEELAPTSTADGLPEEKRVLGNIYVSKGITAKRISIAITELEGK